MDIKPKNTVIKFLKYYIISLVIGYFLLLINSQYKYSFMLEKNLPFWFYIKFLFYNSAWILSTVMVYCGIPACLWLVKDTSFLKSSTESKYSGESILQFSKSILITTVIISSTLFVVLNYILPDFNYKTRIYFKNAHREQYDASILERDLKSGFITDREKNLNLILSDLDLLSSKKSKVLNDKNKKNREAILKHYDSQENIKNIRALNFFAIPIYLFSIILVMLPASIKLKRFTNGHYYISVLAIILFYFLFGYVNILAENSENSILILLSPILFNLIFGSIYLTRINQIYKVSS